MGSIEKVRTLGKNVNDNPIRGIVRILNRDKYLLLLSLPLITYYILFQYAPMYGLVIAFNNFKPLSGITGSEWVGFKWFLEFIHSPFFFRLMQNTFLLGAYNILWAFPIPIIFALMLNEVKDGFFKRLTQTISYLPYFISIVVIVGMMYNFLSTDYGVVNLLLRKLGMNPINFMNDSAWFRTLYIGSNIWQTFGWSSIIYLAAIASINSEIYEAASIDGAGKLAKMIHITIPGIMPTIIILLLLNVGNVMNIGFEKVILMYSPAIYDKADVISTYIYRTGILNARYSYSTAVGLFNSIVNFILLLAVNRFSRKTSSISIW